MLKHCHNDMSLQSAIVSKLKHLFSRPDNILEVVQPYNTAPLAHHASSQHSPVPASRRIHRPSHSRRRAPGGPGDGA